MPSILKILVGEPFISHQKSIMDLLPAQDKYTVKMVWILFMWSSILSIFFTFFLMYSPLLGSLSWYNIICMGLEVVPLVLLVWLYRKVPGMLSTSSESTTTTTVYQYKLVVFIFLFIYALGLVAFVIYWISASFQEFLQRFTATPTKQLVQKTKFDSTHFLFDPLALINARFTNNTILSSKYSELQFLGFETSTCKTLQKDSVPGYPSVSKFITP
jgi:Ca2+/Na+ antiporter